jgi:hypothetical protein
MKVATLFLTGMISITGIVNLQAAERSPSPKRPGAIETEQFVSAGMPTAADEDDLSWLQIFGSSCAAAAFIWGIVLSIKYGTPFICHYGREIPAEGARHRRHRRRRR